MEQEPRTKTPEQVVAVLLENRQRFLGFLRSRVDSIEDAEEILQAAFVRSLQKADQIRDTESAIAWFFRLLRNAVVDHHRRKAAARRGFETLIEQPPAETGMDDPALQNVICTCVHALFDLLKPEYTEMIRRVDLAEEDITSVAAALDITPGNARVRLHRARMALRDELERMCRTCATHGCLDCNCRPPSSSSAGTP